MSEILNSQMNAFDSQPNFRFIFICILLFNRRLLKRKEKSWCKKKGKVYTYVYKEMGLKNFLLLFNFHFNDRFLIQFNS